MIRITQKLGFGILFFLAFVLHAQENIKTVGPTPDVIFETSGLIYFNESLITHNDSGNEPLLYELDTFNLLIKRIITITNAENIDWEAITQDDNFIYIGDFGNNLGTRQDLAIHRISKAEYTSSNTVRATTINYSYIDQLEFTNEGNSDWDAEAFIVLDDQLVIFTKQWKSFSSVAYTIPKTPGVHVATRLGSIMDVGLITDATYNAESKRLVLLGYSTILAPFIGIVENLDKQNLFEGFSQAYLGLSFVQAEGLTQINATNYFFTSEYYSRQNPTIESTSRLFSFQIFSTNTENPEDPKNPEEPELPDNSEQNDRLIIFRNMSTNEYRYTLSTDKVVYGQMIFDILGRRVWKNVGKVETEGTIFQPLESSIYYLTYYLEGGIIATPFAVY